MTPRAMGKARKGAVNRADVPIWRVVGDQVRALRSTKGWRQDDLAASAIGAGLAGWTRATVANVENGSRLLDLGEAIALAVALDVHVVDLIPEYQGTEVRAIRYAQGGYAGAENLRWGLSAGALGEPFATRRDPDGVVGAGRLLFEAEDVNRKAAMSLGIDVDELRRLTDHVWLLSLAQMREIRLVEHEASAAKPLTARSRQAVRGHISRKLIEELRAELAKKERRTAKTTRRGKK